MLSKIVRYAGPVVLSSQGCKTKLEDLLKSKLKYVGAIAVAIIVIQVKWNEMYSGIYWRLYDFI